MKETLGTLWDEFTPLERAAIVRCFEQVRQRPFSLGELALMRIDRVTATVGNVFWNQHFGDMASHDLFMKLVFLAKGIR